MSILMKSLILTAFDRILFISVITIPLIIVIIILRFCLRKHPRKWSYRLWFLLWISILISFTSTVPDSLAFIADQILTQDAGVNTESINKNTGENINGLSPSKAISAKDEQNLYSQYDKNRLETDKLTENSHKKDIRFDLPKLRNVKSQIHYYLYDIKQHFDGFYYAAAIFWAAATSLILSLLMRSYLKVYVRIRTAVKIYDNVFESENVSSPFVWGIFRQKILLPNGLTQNDIKYVTLHEKAHVYHFDNAVLLLSWIVSAIFWFNPLIWLCASLFRSDMEIRCDEYAAAGLNRDGKLEYLSVLIRFAEGKTIRKPLVSMSGRSFFKERINSVMRKPNKNKIAIIAAVIICSLAGVICISFAADYESDVKNDENSVQKASSEDFDYQYLLEQKTYELENKNLSAILTDEQGNILAEIGDSDKKILPGSAMRTIFAANILKAGDIKFDTYVKGNRILCDSGETQTSFSNWKNEPENITFSEAIAEYSRVGLISAFLNSDRDKIENILKGLDFNINNINTEPELAAFILGNRSEISLEKLAELYRNAFKMLKSNASENPLYQNQAEELRAYTVKGIEKYVKKSESADLYNYDINMAGSCGMAENTNLYTAFVGDINTNDKKLILAINVINDTNETENFIGSSDLSYFAKRFFAECADALHV